MVVEQLLTTGGGWQDNVNGLAPGIKLGVSPKSENTMSVSHNVLDASEEFLNRLQERMVLVYTGTVRLAKNLLQVH